MVLDRVGSSTVDYLNGLGIDDKLRQTNAGFGTLYFLRDHLGSTAALINGASSLIERTQYEAFGASAGSALTRYGFTNRELDMATGLIHYRARWLDPQQGRFLSEDPIRYAGGSNSFYVYVRNNPVNRVDPSGLVDEDPRYSINCIGYASRQGKYVRPSQGESLEEFLKKLGYKCRQVSSSKDCRCDSGSNKMMVYIYSYKVNPENKDPYSDPWIRTPGTMDNDIHAVREDAPGSWSYIPNRECREPVRGLNDPDDLFYRYPDRVYCCCDQKCSGK